MSKLKNVKALNEMLKGEHRTQSRKTFGFSDAEYQAEKNKTRQEGEIWEEVNALGETVCWWQQNKHTRSKYRFHPSVSVALDELRESMRSFPNCQKETCTCKSPTRLDEKFRRMTGMCEDCLISLETKLKIRGEFNEYALNKMKANADAFFKDADKEVEVIKRELKNLGFVDNEFGDVEKWTFDDVDAYLQKIDNSYQEFKEKTLERFTTEK